MKCDICNSEKNHIEVLTCEYKIKDRIIKLECERRICDNCYSPIYDEICESRIAKMAIQKYNSLYGIDREKLIDLRKKIGLSQENFSKIIGCAKKTLISYEKGSSVPNDIYLIVLKMIISDPETLLFLLRYNEDRFDKKEYETYVNKIFQYISNNKVLLEDDSNFVPSIYNGFTKINYSKIKNIILLICREGIFKTKLLKELFYCDFLNYKESGYSITGLEYARLPFGPVPDDYEDIICSLIENKQLQCITEIVNGVEKNTLKSTSEFSKEVFSNEELEVIERVIKKFKDYTVGKIEDYSHEERAWKETKTGQMISYEYSFDINLS